MKKTRALGDSSAQRLAEAEIISKLKLESGMIFAIPGSKARVEIDGYSDSKRVLCEIYSHYGELRGSQVSKIMKDVLKLVFLKKKIKKLQQYSLWYAFCDKKAAELFKSDKDTWMAQCFQEFGVKIKIEKLSSTIEKKVKNAQRVQKR